jgi:NAD(P)-dependent dehydrogenase (short-subunit alcohol dehydrogenase family)
LQGILHAGAALASRVIAGITAASIRSEFSGKVHGAWSMLQHSRAAPLRMVNLFSSLAAFSGSGGQGSYAAANAALDDWAQSMQVPSNLCCIGGVQKASPLLSESANRAVCTKRCSSRWAK